MRVLLIEILRRHKPLQLLGAAMVAGLWYLVPGEDDAVPAAIGAAAWSAYFIGPGRALQMIPPAAAYLPISRRDMWRATWLASTVWPTALVTAAMLVAMLVPATRATMGFAAVTLSAVYAFAFAGAGCVIVMFLAEAGSHPRVARPLRDFFTGMGPMLAMGGLYVGIWGARFVPAQWSEFSPSAALRLVSTIGLVTAVYFYSPRVTGSPPLRAGAKRSATERAAQPVPSSRLTGVPRLLWNEGVWTLSIAAGIVVLGLVVVMVFDTFVNTQRLAAGVVRNQLVQLFDRNSAGPEFGFGYIFWLILYVVATVARFGFIIRHLRVLPVRPLQLNAIFVAWPAAVLVTVWGVLLAAYVLVVGQPVTSLSLGILVSVIGASALTRSIGLRWQHGWAALMVLVPLSGVLTALPMPRLPGQTLLLTGVACLLAAALLNRATLGHSAAYRRPTMAIGLPPPR